MPANIDNFTPNPFTLVFDALWSCLESSPEFTQDVKQNNRIHLNLSNKPNPLKLQIADSDLPEVILTQTGASDINILNTSGTSKIVMQYQWLLATGDIRVQNYLNQVQWDIFIGMTGWTSLLGALIWPTGTGNDDAHHFVKRSNLVSVTTGLDDPKENRGIRGWSSIWACEVEMHFAQVDLINARGY